MEDVDIMMIMLTNQYAQHTVKQCVLIIGMDLEKNKNRFVVDKFQEVNRMKIAIELPDHIHDMICRYGFITKSCIETAAKAIKEGEEIPQGEWIRGGFDDRYYICSKCGFKASECYDPPKFKNCPMCGSENNVIVRGI